ncbi:hypothetical protein ACFQ4C_07045 [Larkinella insperata]|uniref:Uncharacterized protein n=1 Tax=Larkinella insperata TaxID=332158 RepID=A0ABW3Q6R6_9BACT
MKHVFKSCFGMCLLLFVLARPALSQSFTPYDIQIKEDLSPKTLVNVERALRKGFNTTSPNIIEYRFKSKNALIPLTQIPVNGSSRRPELWVYYFIPRKNLVLNQEIEVQLGSIPGRVRKMTAWIACEDGIIVYDVTPEKNGLTPGNTLTVAPTIGGKLLAFRR